MYRRVVLSQLHLPAGARLWLIPWLGSDNAHAHAHVALLIFTMYGWYVNASLLFITFDFIF